MKTKLNLLAAGMFLAGVNAGLGQSTVQFSATTYSVPEWAGTVTLTVQRTNDLSTEVRVYYATADGTATNGLKYAATNGTLAFAAGETNQSIVVPILDEGFVEGSKTFTVTLSNPTDAVLGARTIASASLTLTWSLSFSSPPTTPPTAGHCLKTWAQCRSAWCGATMRISPSPWTSPPPT